MEEGREGGEGGGTCRWVEGRTERKGGREVREEVHVDG